MEKQRMKSEALFKEKPVWSAIIYMAVPSCISILIMVIYNMADMFFIGQLEDTALVAAVSVVGPVFSLVTAAATMLGVGGCSVIANAAGAGRVEEAKSYASVSCWAAVLFGIAAAVILLAGTEPILKLLGANSEILVPAGVYMRILALGAPFMLLSVVLATLLRADGAIREGLIGNMAGTVLNMLLDPLFILVLHKGAAGAAAATVIGNMASSGFYLFYVLRKSAYLSVSPGYAMRRKTFLLPILGVGLPNGISSILSGFASTFSNQLLAFYGTNAIAAMAAAGKTTMIIGMIQMGICMGVQPMMAYNYGAGNLPRLKEILQKLGILSFVLGTAAAAGSFLARHTLIQLFLKNADAAAMGEQMVFFLVIASPVVGFYYLSTNFLQASGNAGGAVIVSVLRQGAVLIPCLYLMERLFGFRGIAAAYTISDVLSAAAAAAVCIWQYHMLKKKIFAPETGKRKEDGYGIKSGTADYAGNCYKE